MKKILMLLLLVAAAFWFYGNQASRLSDPGAFDDQGNARVLLFIRASCPPCAEVSAELRSRGIAFEEIDVLTEKGRSRYEKYGVRLLPLMVVGNRQVTGSDLPAITAALAEGAGIVMLTPLEQQAMSSHFDSEGKPLVVMYGTGWCGFCKKLRNYLEGRNVPYEFRDVEGDGRARVNYEALRGRGYPLTFVGFRRIDGYDESRLNRALKELL